MTSMPVHPIHTTEGSEPGTNYRVMVPAYYTSPDEEFDTAVNEGVAMDRSFFERIEVTGKDRLDLLHRLSTNDLNALNPGHATGTVFSTDKGRVVDYVYVIVFESSLLLIASPGHQETLVKWIGRYTITEDIKLSAITQRTSMISLIGPHAISFAETLLGSGLQPNRVTRVPGFGGMNAVILRQEFGTTIVDFVVEAAEAVQLWQEFSKVGIPSMGFNAYEAFRISRGIPSIGKEISESFNPYEIGLYRTISFTKGCYIGQEVIARLDTYQKITRQPIGVVFGHPLSDDGLPASLTNESGEVGWLTSISETAIHGKFIGLGIIRKEASTVGQSVWLSHAGESHHGIIAGLPILA
jgi:tRNA-modifying protein YgfZ